MPFFFFTKLFMINLLVDLYTIPLLNEKMKRFHFTNKETEGCTFFFFLEKRKQSIGFGDASGILGGGCCEDCFPLFYLYSILLWHLVSDGFLTRVQE